MWSLNKIFQLPIKLRVFFYMRKEGSKEKLDKELATTLAQMAILTDTFSNSLSQPERYDASELESIRTLEEVCTQLSASLLSLIGAFKGVNTISSSDAVLATETIEQCKEFIATMQSHLLAD